MDGHPVIPTLDLMFRALQVAHQLYDRDPTAENLFRVEQATARFELTADPVQYFDDLQEVRSA